MMDSFNMRGWRHKYITMAENESAVVDQKMPRKWYVDNYDTIIEDIIRQGHSAEEAEELWNTMYQMQCTYEDALAAQQEAAEDEARQRAQDAQEDEYIADTDEDSVDYNYVYEYFSEDEDSAEAKLKEAEKRFLSSEK